MSREILFYSDFPFGYHNPEAEEKMTRFAQRGWVVHYIEQLGIRNPRPTHLGRLAATLLRGREEPADTALDVVSPKLLFPRRAPGITRLNELWLARQLTSALEDPARAVIWIRYPTPELVPFLDEVDAALTIYEVVDDHARSPGMNARLRRMLEAAEEEVLARAGLVFAWSEPIRERLAAVHPNVILASTAIDVARFAAAAGAAPEARRAVYVGSLGFRFDAALLADVAELMPDWTFTLAGPLEGDSAKGLEGIANIELPGRVTPDRVPELIAGAGVCMLPYGRTAYNEMLFPIKLVEYLAAGRPVVSTGIRAARELDDLLELADGPADFAAAIRRAAADDSAATRARRLARARRFDWSNRLDEMEAAIEAALARP